MQANITHDALNQATRLAWLVTGVLGFFGGVALMSLFRLLKRVTQMTVLAGVLASIGALCLFAALQETRYRIEEKPFEPPVWIHPGPVSLYLPGAAILLGVVVANIVGRRPRHV